MSLLGYLLFFGGIVLIGSINASIEADNRDRHRSQYGKVARCYHCGSTNVYRMNYDDKYKSIAFWGAASSKIGKMYHCDNCGREW